MIAVPGAARVTILPLGDSITRGDYAADSADGSWRYYLGEQLTAAGYDVDFVGSTTFPTYTRFDFDQDHDGHGGYTTGMFLSYGETEPLKAWMAAYGPPDVVLLMIGTNDALLQVPLADRTREPPRDHRPAPREEPRRDDPRGPDHPDRGREPERAADRPVQRGPPGPRGELSTPQSPIIVVDQYSGYDGDGRQRGRRDPPRQERDAEDRGAVVRGARAGPLRPRPDHHGAADHPAHPGPHPACRAARGPAGDPNGDGLCEDVNGNGRKDFADVVLLFNQLDWCSRHAPWAFDFNGNGRVDFADVVRLFTLLG